MKEKFTVEEIALLYGKKIFIAEQKQNKTSIEVLQKSKEGNFHVFVNEQEWKNQNLQTLLKNLIAALDINWKDLSVNSISNKTTKLQESEFSENINFIFDDSFQKSFLNPEKIGKKTVYYLPKLQEMAKSKQKKMQCWNLIKDLKL